MPTLVVGMRSAENRRNMPTTSVGMAPRQLSLAGTLALRPLLFVTIVTGTDLMCKDGWSRAC